MIRVLLITTFFALTADNSLSQTGWVQQVSGTSVDLHSIIFNHGNEDIVWACGDNGVIVHTSNGGTSWVLQTSGTTKHLYSICFMEISGGPVFAVGEDGIILRTTNNGSNWMPIPSPTAHTLRDISDFNFVAVGDSGTIIKSSNQGINWALVSSPTTQRLNGVCATFSSYIVGENGTFLKGAGNVWQVGSSGTTNNLFGVPLFGSADITVGASGLILKSTNFGTNWSTLPSGTASILRSVEYSTNNTSRIYVCGENGTILKSTNSGVSWGFQTTPNTNNLNSIFFYLNDATGYACGNNGTILKTTNGGGTIFTSVSNQNHIAERFELSQNYPNPFNPITKIKFSIPKSSLVKIIIYDLTGREIETLVDQQLTTGEYETDFDGSDLSSGVYFYKLVADEFTETRKMVLVK